MFYLVSCFYKQTLALAVSVECRPSLKLDYLDSFHERLPEAYERLIIDILRGEQTLFMRQDELEAAWAWIESIKNGWEKTNFKNILYEINYNL